MGTHSTRAHTRMAQESAGTRAKASPESPEPRLAGFVISLIASWYGGEGLTFHTFLTDHTLWVKIG